MQEFATILTILYLAVLGLICVYGAHRYWMVLTLYKMNRKDQCKSPELKFTKLPLVTIQLPMFNERRVAERIIKAACAIEYPRGRLQIQVLDDSTDESAQVAEECCEQMASRGHAIQYIHRTNRNGYKAGALANGMNSATGELIAIFDADFVPPPDFLLKTIHHFTNPKIGMVQTRWSHLNRNDSLLTKVQAMYLDGHFVIEQAARAASGRWFNFNGTAGIWRRSTIENAGGWQHDTLTEDTDLSYRAQLKNWQFRYLSDVHCPAEIPPTVSAFLSQQHRWNKGLIQTALKLLPRIFQSNAPFNMKAEAWFHLSSPLVHFLILLLALLVIPTIFVISPIEGPNTILAAAVALVFLTFGILAASTFYIASQRAQGTSFFQTLLLLPLLMAVGIGVTIVNTRAVIEAVVGKQTPFVRTPKFNGESISDSDPVAHEYNRLFPAGTFEIVIGLFMAACAAASFFHTHTLVATPFIILFASGFLTVGTSQLMEGIRRPT